MTIEFPLWIVITGLLAAFVAALFIVIVWLDRGGR